MSHWCTSYLNCFLLVCTAASLGCNRRRLDILLRGKKVTYREALFQYLKQCCWVAHSIPIDALCKIWARDWLFQALISQAFYSICRGCCCYAVSIKRLISAMAFLCCGLANLPQHLARRRPYHPRYYLHSKRGKSYSSLQWQKCYFCMKYCRIICCTVVNLGMYLWSWLWSGVPGLQQLIHPSPPAKRTVTYKNMHRSVGPRQLCIHGLKYFGNNTYQPSTKASIRVITFSSSSSSLSVRAAAFFLPLPCITYIRYVVSSIFQNTSHHNRQ